MENCANWQSDSIKQLTTKFLFGLEDLVLLQNFEWKLKLNINYIVKITTTEKIV